MRTHILVLREGSANSDHFSISSLLFVPKSSRDEAIGILEGRKKIRTLLRDGEAADKIGINNILQRLKIEGENKNEGISELKRQQGLIPFFYPGDKVEECVSSDTPLEFVVEEESGSPSILSLPKEMEEKLREYLSVENEIAEFLDCGAFIHLLASIEFIRSDLTKKWDVREIHGISEINPGDVVLFGNSSKNGIKVGEDSYIKSGDHHYAMYLGNGYFLGKISNLGIAVQSAESIFETFGEFDNIFVLTKKSL